MRTLVRFGGPLAVRYHTFAPIGRPTLYSFDLERLISEHPHRTRAILKTVCAKIARGELGALPHRVFEASEIREAFQAPLGNRVQSAPNRASPVKRGPAQRLRNSAPMKCSLAALLVLTLLLPAFPQPQKPIPPEAVEIILTKSWFVLRSLDYHNSRQIYKFLEQIRDVPNPPERYYVFFGPAALAPLLQDYGEGDYALVLEKAPQAAKAARNPSRALEIQLLHLSAADSIGRPALVRQLLPEVERLAAQAPGARGQLSRYIVAHFKAMYDFESHRPDPQELERRAQEALKLLDGLKFDDDFRRSALVEIPLMREAFLFWMRKLSDRGLIELTHQHYSALFTPLLGPAGEEHPDALDQMSCWQLLRGVQMELLFDMVSRFALLGTFTPEKAYEYIDPTLQTAEEEYKQFEQMAEKESMFILWFRGPISRSLAWGHRARARITLARLREDPTQVTPEQQNLMGQHLGRALDVAQGTSDEETRIRMQLDFLEGLILARPPGWEQGSSEILADMERAWGNSPNKRFPLLQALLLKGRLRAREKRIPEAIEALSKAIAILEAYAQESGQGAAEEIRRNWSEEYELLARLQLEAGQTAQAADTLDRHSQLATLREFPLTSLQAARPELRGAVALQEKMVGLEQKADQDPKAAALLAQTRSEFYQTLADLQKKEPAYARLSVRPNNFSRLQAVLPEDSVLVQFFPAEEQLYLFVATREALKIHRVPVKAERLRELVAEFRRHVVAYGRGGGSFDWASSEGESLAAILTELGDALWAPIQADLKGKKLVAFIPTESLSYLPLQVLARPREGPRPRLLVEEMAVSVVAKSSDLESLGRPAVKTGKTMLALADPDGSLLGARAEATEIARLFPDSEVRVGAEATADQLQPLKSDVGYLHLATHGIVDVSQPTDSYLLMAGQDKQLSVTEIAGLDLGPVRLVTLSACQSAMADRLPDIGTELYSLADAFAFAGSPSLVASLWKVSDRSTRALMLLFYEQLAAGLPRAEALRQAELKMLGQPATAHPFHWAGFVLMGDWR